MIAFTVSSGVWFVLSIQMPVSRMVAWSSVSRYEAQASPRVRLGRSRSRCRTVARTGARTMREKG